MRPFRHRPWLEPTAAPPGEDLIGLGGDLDPQTLLTGYASGVFPMGVGRGGTGPIGWWSPDPRGVLPVGSVRVSRSLRRSLKRFEIRVDTAFEEVVVGCADPSRSAGWITPRMAAAYQRLHRLGWAHSVECYLDGELAGGLYGVAVGGLFAGESMFHRATDASKAALVALDGLLGQDGDPRRLVDVQWSTPHLQSLGARSVSRREYLSLLDRALRAPLPAAWSRW